MNDAIVLAALLRSDLRFFIRKAFHTILPGTPYLPNWHIEAIVYQLMRVNAGDVNRLLINQPPRSLKSICVSVAYVAWLLGHDPTRRVIVVSYSNELAIELHRQFRMIIEASWFRALFPAMRVARDTGTELITTAGGSRYATSVGGTLTGRGADLIIVDDPLKAEEANSDIARKRVNDWYSGSLVSRLNDKDTGAIVVVMQRLHENDLAGSLLARRGWEHLDLPAIAVEDSVIPLGQHKVKMRAVGDILHPERESKEALGRIKAEIGSLKFSSQYHWSPATFAEVKGIIHSASPRPTMSLETRERLLSALAKARTWIDDLVGGRVGSFFEIAAQEGRVERHIRLLAPLAFVSPRIIAAIMDGSLAAAPSVTGMAQCLPYSWSEQSKALAPPRSSSGSS